MWSLDGEPSATARLPRTCVEQIAHPQAAGKRAVDVERAVGLAAILRQSPIILKFQYTPYY
jgi:hypothetical protein